MDDRQWRRFCALISDPHQCLDTPGCTFLGDKKTGEFKPGQARWWHWRAKGMARFGKCVNKLKEKNRRGVERIPSNTKVGARLHEKLIAELKKNPTEQLMYTDLPRSIEWLHNKQSENAEGLRERLHDVSTETLKWTVEKMRRKKREIPRDLVEELEKRREEELQQEELQQKEPQQKEPQQKLQSLWFHKILQQKRT